MHVYCDLHHSHGNWILSIVYKYMNMGMKQLWGDGLEAAYISCWPGSPTSHVSYVWYQFYIKVWWSCDLQKHCPMFPLLVVSGNQTQTSYITALLAEHYIIELTSNVHELLWCISTLPMKQLEPCIGSSYKYGDSGVGSRHLQKIIYRKSYLPPPWLT